MQRTAPPRDAKGLRSDEIPEDEVPGYKNYVVYTDESGMHGAKYYGFGSLWIPWERRGDFQKQFAEIRARHRLDDELKWTKVTRRTAPFVKDVIAWFFSRNWMMFHSIVVPRADVDWSLHEGRDEAQQKHFTMLLRNKIGYFAEGGGKLYRIRIDPLPWRYGKSDEVVHKILNSQLKAEFGHPLVHDIVACESKTTVGIQVTDVLLGAVMGAWQEDVVAEHKLSVMGWIAEHLGWQDLRHDTLRDEWKFNVWHFFDPPSGKRRRATSIPVMLKYPMPPFRPRRSR